MGGLTTDEIATVLDVLYLICYEVYNRHRAKLLRNDLSHEAMRRTRIVRNLQSDDTEIAGLLSLMLLTDARRLARTVAEGELIPAAFQNIVRIWSRGTGSKRTAARKKPKKRLAYLY